MQRMIVCINSKNPDLYIWLKFIRYMLAEDSAKTAL